MTVHLRNDSVYRPIICLTKFMSLFFEHKAHGVFDFTSQFALTKDCRSKCHYLFLAEYCLLTLLLRSELPSQHSIFDTNLGSRAANLTSNPANPD